MVTCQVIEQQLRAEMKALSDAELASFAQAMGVDADELDERSDIENACVTLELKCFTH
jgi:hypothetical protein